MKRLLCVGIAASMCLVLAESRSELRAHNLQGKSALPLEADFKKAQAKLTEAPDDAEANTLAGKYLAFVEGNYQEAMPFLSKSADKTLRTLAEHERAPANTDTAPKKIGMGDEWVAGAKTFPALHRQFLDRAAFWYSTAWPDLDPVWKNKAREQANKLAASRPPGAPKKGLGTGWVSETLPGSRPATLDGGIARSGSYSVKLIPADEKVADSVSRFRTEYIPVAGKVLEVSAYVRSDGTENGADRLFVFFFDNNGTGIGTVGPYVPVDMPFWTRVSSKVEVPANVVRVVFGASLASKKGALWVDDMSLKFDGKEALKNGAFEDR